MVLLTSPTRVGTIATGSTISPKSSSKPDIIQGKVSINDNKQCWSRKRISLQAGDGGVGGRARSQLIIDQNKPPTYSPWLSGLQEKTTNCESSVEIQAPCNLQYRDFDKTYSEFARSYSGKRNLIICLIMYLESLGVFQPPVRNMRHW